MTSLHPVHADAHRILTTWTPPDEQQARLRTEYLDFIAQHEDAVERRCRIGHVTASALLVSPRGDEVLLTLHARIGRWLQLGGHIEADDASLIDAALREAREESGIVPITIDPVPLRLDRHQVNCSDKRGGFDVLDHWDIQFLARAHDRIHTISEESTDLAWWPMGGLPEVDESVGALTAAAVHRLASPR